MKEDPEDEINIPVQLVSNVRMRLHTIIVFLNILYSILHVASYPHYFTFLFMTALLQTVEHQHGFKDVSLQGKRTTSNYR